MRNRRKKRFKEDSKNFSLPDLNLLSMILKILIIIALMIFIFSSIRVKKSLLIANRNSTNVVIDAVGEKEENVNTIKEDEENINTVKENKEDETTTNEIAISNSENQIEKNTIQSSSSTINIAFTGDIMCQNSIYEDAYNSSTDSYDFSYIFENIKYNLQTADITVGSLDTTFAGKDKKYSGNSILNTPESLAYTLKKIGFDVLSTANSHCYDKGYEGIENTIKYLNDADISHTGTYTSADEQNKILIKNVKGIKIAFLSFTYSTNGISVSQDKSYSVNLANEATILTQLRLAKLQSPDLIIANMNWGIEYQTTPNNEQKKLANLLFENGADIIIGNHPHILQSMEKKNIILNDKTQKNVFVAYSLGNFLADQNKKNTQSSAILNLSITKDTDNKISINSVNYTPTYIYKDTSNTLKKFKILNLKNTVSAYQSGFTDGIDQKLFNTLNNEFNNVKKSLGDELN